MMSKRNAIKLLQVVPSLGNLLKPVQYAIRRFSDVIKDREKAEESIYVRKREDSELRIRRKELESEVKAIYSESGDSLSEAMLTKLVKWKLRDEILHG